jgi:hypothetical protein
VDARQKPTENKAIRVRGTNDTRTLCLMHAGTVYAHLTFERARSLRAEKLWRGEGHGRAASASASASASYLAEQ